MTRDATRAKPCETGVSVTVTKAGAPCEPCKDASGADDVEVAEAAGAALGEALKQFLAPGVAAVAAGEIPAAAARGTFAAPLDEAYSTCTMNVAPSSDSAAAAAGGGRGRCRLPSRLTVPAGLCLLTPQLRTLTRLNYRSPTSKKHAFPSRSSLKLRAKTCVVCVK